MSDIYVFLKPIFGLSYCYSRIPRQNYIGKYVFNAYKKIVQYGVNELAPRAFENIRRWINSQ